MSLYRDPSRIHPALQRFPWTVSEILCDTDTRQPRYYSLIFKETYIRTDGSLREVIFPYTQHPSRFHFIIHLPYDSLPQPVPEFPYCADIPWQTIPIHQLPSHIQSIHLYSPQLEFSPTIDVLPCRIDPDDPNQLYAIDDRSSAPYLFIRSTWKTPKGIKSSYYYERRHKHCNSEFISSLKKSLHAVVFCHIVNKKLPQGVDYWLLPTKSPA